MDFVKVIIVVFVYFYLIKVPLFNLIPALNNLPKPFDDIIMVIITLYLEELITIRTKIGNNHIYGNGN